LGLLVRRENEEVLAGFDEKEKQLLIDLLQRHHQRSISQRRGQTGVCRYADTHRQMDFDPFYVQARAKSSFFALPI
jgi:hypothetical protein